MWVRASEEQLKTGVHAIKLEDREGLWMEKPDLWSKYLRRPDSLEDICFAQFAKMYKGASGKSEDFDDEMEEEHEENDESEDEISEKKFHYIMTFKDNGLKSKALPEMIKLKNSSMVERQKVITTSLLQMQMT